MTRASLPMYDRAETHAANQRLWDRIRNALGAAGQEDLVDGVPIPRRLSLPEDLWAHWLAPDLVFSQTCGLPFRTRLYPDVTLIGAPDFRLPGCPPGYYNSVVIVRNGDTRTDPENWPGMVLACNDAHSQSGWAAPQNHAAELGLSFQRILLTGSHRASAQAVAQGRADIAAIDAQTWRMIERWDDNATVLQEVTRTAPTPALPYITGKGLDPDRMRNAVSAAIAGLPPADRDALDLHGLVDVGVGPYLAIPTPPFPAANARKIG